MRLFMTDGMFGQCLEQIGPEFKTMSELMKELQNWKSNKTIRKLYKIEPYDRFVFDNERSEIAIDFGDYKTFMLVTNARPEFLDEICIKEGK